MAGMAVQQCRVLYASATLKEKITDLQFTSDAKQSGASSQSRTNFNSHPQDLKHHCSSITS